MMIESQPHDSFEVSRASHPRAFTTKQSYAHFGSSDRLTQVVLAEDLIGCPAGGLPRGGRVASKRTNPAVSLMSELLLIVVLPQFYGTSASSYHSRLRAQGVCRGDSNPFFPQHAGNQ